MKVLIADKFEQSGIDALKALGCSVIASPDLTADNLADAVVEHDPDVLVVRSTKVQAPVFERARSLSLVLRAGAGYDTIDTTAASANAIYVANCPGKNSIAVAELVWGLILSCDRCIPEQTAELRSGTWNKKEYSKARGLYGRTLGVIGAGNIAQEVIDRGRAFGMNILVWSRGITPKRAAAMGATAAESPVALAREADVITINIAATSETRNFVNAEFCNAMKPGAFLINTSRGSVVEEAALLAAIRDKGVRAGLDVYQNEPAATDKSFTSELARTPGVCGTHHIGASTDQAQQAIADEAVRIIQVYLETGSPPNVVNRCAKTPATRLLVVRHLNKPGVLAHVIGEIGKAGINIEEMDNEIYLGAEAACAKISLDAEPSQDTMNTISSGSPHILSVSLTSID